MRSMFLRTGCALCLLFVTVVPVSAQDRPFRADGAGSVSQDGQIYATGEAIHFGRSLLYLKVDRDLLESGLFELQGAHFFTAGNDYAYLDLDVEFNPVTRVAQGTLNFVGGTGRFQNASGQTQVVLQFDELLQHVEFAAEGSIDY